MKGKSLPSACPSAFISIFHFHHDQGGARNHLTKGKQVMGLGQNSSHILFAITHIGSRHRSHNLTNIKNSTNEKGFSPLLLFK